MTFAMNDKYIVSASNDFTIKVFETLTGELIKIFTDHTDKVLCLDFKNNLLASGSKDRSIKIFNLK